MPTLLDDYVLLERLAQGGLSQVFLAEDRRDLSLVAVKLIAKAQLDPADLFHVQTELNVLRRVDHPNIVRMIDCEETPAQIVLVLEYMRGGELFDRIVERGSFSEGEAAAALRAVMQAVRYCHALGVVHRDLKPENILYESAEPGARLKIGDFGVSRIRTTPHESLSTVVGSASYQAPEVLRGRQYDDKCDVYSAGVVLYILLCGFPPFDEEDPGFLEAMETGALAFPSPEWDGVSPEARDLVRRMMAPQPQERLSAKEVLQHAFFALPARSGSLCAAVDNLGNYSSWRRRVSSGPATPTPP